MGAVSLLGCAGMTPAVASRSPGETLYLEHCESCHDRFAPEAYSDAQWRGVIDRMQAEAGLTDPQAFAVLAWLQESN